MLPWTNAFPSFSQPNVRSSIWMDGCPPKAMHYLESAAVNDQLAVWAAKWATLSNLNARILQVDVDVAGHSGK